MTIDEAIKEFTDWAKDNRNEQNFWAAERNESYDETDPLSYADCDGLARDAETRAEYNEQLVEWLTELKEAKRLLGEALRTLNDSSCNKDCRQCKWNEGGCEMSCRFAWKYGDEVLELIGDENDAE